MKPLATEIALARRIVRVLKVKSLAGVGQPSDQPVGWEGYCNGEGREVGTEIDAIIAAAERIIKKADANH